MRWWVTCFCLAIALGATPQSFAAESLKIKGSPQARLQFSIIIPQILSLQLNSEYLALAAKDFNTAGRADGALRNPLKVASSVPGRQAIVLTANTASAFSDGAGTSPLEKVSSVSAEDVKLSAATRGVNPRGDHWQGSRNRTGGYSFNYLGHQKQMARNHPGPIIYTLSSP